MKRLAALVTVFGLLTMAVLAKPVFAFNPTQDACSGNTSSSVCTTNQTENPISGKNGILTQAINILSIGIGLAAVLVIMIAGFRFITSQGDPATINSAKNTILYAVIGLVVVALAQTLVIFVLNKVSTP